MLHHQLVRSKLLWCSAAQALNVFKPAAQFSRKKAVRPDFR